MKRYEKYIHNDSVILATLPEGWRYLPLKYIAKFYTGNSLNDKEKDLFSETIGEALPYIATKDISPVSQSADYDNGISIPKSEISYKVAPKDSFLICIEGGSAGRKMTYLTQDVCFVNKLCCIDAKESKKYLYYAFQSAPFQSDFKQSLQGLIGGVSISKLSDMRFAIPSLDEQLKISAFLDYKTGKIDRLTEMLCARIENLKNYRRSMINEAVTHGLNKSVEFKPSGVDWIGDIPKHWHTSKIQYLTQNLDHLRQPISAAERERNNPQYDYYGASGVIDKIDHYNVDDTVLLIGEDGANLVGRNLPLIYKASGKFWVNNHAHILKPNERSNYEYLYYVMEAADYTHYITGALQPKLSQASLANVILPVPPISEQFDIAEYLDRKTKQIDDTIAATEQQIKDLQAYRISLISEAVTGQIDVRDWAAPIE